MVDKLNNLHDQENNFYSINGNIISNAQGYKLRCTGLFQFEFENSNTAQKFHFHCFLKIGKPKIAETYLLSPLRWDDGKEVLIDDTKLIHKFLTEAF